MKQLNNLQVIASLSAYRREAVRRERRARRWAWVRLGVKALVVAAGWAALFVGLGWTAGALTAAVMSLLGWRVGP